MNTTTRIKFILPLLLLAQVPLRAAPDEIGAWLAKQGEFAFLFNGRVRRIDLASSATPAQLVAALRVAYPNRPVADYRITEVKKISNSSSLLNGATVVLITRTDGSQTIFIFEFFSIIGGWNWRSYDLSAPPK